MYQAPDFIRVDVSVKEVFANYDTGCPFTEYLAFTSPCVPGDPNYFYSKYIDSEPIHQCYAVKNQ